MDQSDADPVDSAPSDDDATSLPHRSAIGWNPDKQEVTEPKYIGGFEILGKLGEGGMGTVWRARRHFTRREVALKLLNASPLNSEVARRRFEREVEVASLLEHPNIARVYESGIVQGAYFFAMELVEGLALHEFVRQHRLNRRRSLSMMSVVCRAIQYAHQKGVIHRDLKPSNILVDSSSVPHIVDFGLGKLIDDQAPISTISIQGDWAGTPAYMSPEQAKGLTGEIDTRSDIYSLGVVLYEIVTGRLPHDSTGGSLAVLERVAHAEIVRPRAAAPGIDRDLESLLLKALSKHPEERYASVGELADDIDNYINGEAIKARRPTAIYFLRKKIRKFRVPIVAAAIVAIMIVGLIVHYSLRLTQERNLALAAAANERILRHASQVNLAESLVLIAEDMERDRHWHNAVSRFWDAYRIQRVEGVSTINTTLGLLDAGRHSPGELSKFMADAQSPQVPIGVTFDVDGYTAWAELSSGISQSYDLLTGHAETSVGREFSRGQALSIYDCPESHCIYRLHVQLSSPEFASSEIQKVNLENKSIDTTLTFAGYSSVHTAITLDGRHMATAGWLAEQGKGPRIWNLWLVDAGSTSRLLTPRAEGIRAIAFAPDGRSIAAGDTAGGVRFWDTATLAEIHPVAPDNMGSGVAASCEASCVKYKPDGSGLMVGRSDGSVAFIALSAARQSKRFGNSSGRVGVIEFSRDERLTISGDDTGMLCLWDNQSGDLLRAFSAGSGIVSIRFSSDDRLILASTRNGSIHMWPIELAQQTTLCHLGQPAECVAVSPDDLVAAVGAANAVNVIDIATGHRIWSSALTAQVISVAFSVDGKTLDAATSDGAISRFEVFGQWRRIGGCAPGTAFQGLDRVQPKVAAVPLKKVLLLPACDLAVDLTFRGAIFIGLNRGNRSRVIDGAFMPLGCVSADGRKILAVVSNPFLELRTIDAASGTSSTTRLQQYHLPTALAISLDSNTAYVANDDNTLHAIDLLSGQELWSTLSGNQDVNNLTVSADGVALLAGSRDGVLRLWATKDGEKLRDLMSGSGAISTSTFSPKGDVILCDSVADHSVFIWNLSLPAHLHDEEERATQARRQLITDPSNTNAASVLVDLYQMQGAIDCGARLLAIHQDEADLGVAAARCRWQANKFEAAADDYDVLSRQSNLNLSVTYLQACRTAAAQRQ